MKNASNFPTISNVVFTLSGCYKSSSVFQNFSMVILAIFQLSFDVAKGIEGLQLFTLSFC